MIQSKILVVDDSEINVEILVEILQDEYQVLVAESGKKALELVDKELPELILLDVMMPDMNGYEVCQRLKENDLTKNIPIIFLTALNDIENEERGLSLGAVDYITKPLNLKLVKARVKNQILLKGYQNNLENIVRQRTKELELANQAKSLFLDNMSHEIKTPLNGMFLVKELILGTKLTEEQKGYIDIFEESLKRLMEFSNSLLNISNIEQGNVELNLKKFSLNESLKKIFELFEISAKTKNLIFTMDIEKDIPEELIGDIGKIEQIFINLLSNALKFTETGQIQIFIKKVFEYETGIQFKVEIIDTGVGIDEEKLFIIFEPFVQGDLTYTREYQGAGLGLSISKRFIESLGGNIEVISSIDSGTRVVFTFNVKKN